MRMPLAAFLVRLLVLPGALPGQAKRTRAFPRYGLSLTLPELENLQDTSDGGRIGFWSGKLGRSTVTIRLDILPEKEYRLREPGDVVDFIAYDKQRSKPGFNFTERSSRKGPYGFVPYASLARSEERPAGETQLSGHEFFLGGILVQDGYMIEVSCRPPLTQEQSKVILDFLKNGVHYDGEVRNGAWTKERVEKRWKQDAPAGVANDLKVIRTKHYVVMTNSSSGKLFAKKMEDCYAKIRRVFPFDEIEGRELMPVFLFRLPDEYYEFYMKMTGVSLDAAKASKGHAWNDCYATWYCSPKDSVHIHEATHQIFMNRLHLTGGGSWFQEGVAEYICTQKNERNNVRHQIHRGTYAPLKTLFKLNSLLYSSGARTLQGRDPGRDNYMQAALLIEFLRESKWGKGKFQEFVHTIGQLPDNDLTAIEGALRKLYGVDIQGLEEAFLRYCK